MKKTTKKPTRKSSPQAPSVSTGIAENEAGRIQLLPVDSLVPNDWNPNRMDPSRFAEFVEEVRRLNRVPKPIVVRPINAEKYEIIDGEHAWRAAKEAELTLVLCDVLEVGDYEAMRQTFTRNQHGDHNPLREGQMFQKMIEASGISKRELAKKANISDGKVRNSLAYVAAWERRKSHVNHDCVDEINQLSVRQIEMYLDLPPEVGNPWLDAGGRKGDVIHYSGWEGPNLDILQAIVDSGLACTLEPEPGCFKASFQRAAALSRWREKHRVLSDLDDPDKCIAVDEYVIAVGKLQLTDDCLAHLPLEQTDVGARVLISCDEWAKILRTSAAVTRDERALHAKVAEGVHAALARAGIAADAVVNPRAALQFKELEDAPDYIRDAEYMSIDARLELARIAPEDSSSSIEMAKRLTCEIIREHQQDLEKTCNAGSGRGCPQSDFLLVNKVFNECLKKINHEEAVKRVNQILSGQESSVQYVANVLKRTSLITSTAINGRPAAEVLDERLRGIPHPELTLILSFFLEDEAGEAAANRWLELFPRNESIEATDLHSEKPPPKKKVGRTARKMATPAATPNQ